MMRTSSSIYVIIFLLTLQVVNAQKKYVVTSPDKTIAVEITISDSVYYKVLLDHKELLSKSAIGLTTTVERGKEWKVKTVAKSSHSEVLQPIVWQKLRK
jgi:alpha-glucosidase